MGLPFAVELRRSELDRKRRLLEISAEHVRFDGKEVSCSEVDGVRYGSMTLRSGVGKFGNAEIFEFRLRSRDGKTLRVTFSASFGKKKKEDLRTLFYEILDALSEAVTARLVAGISTAWQNGTPLTVGRVRFEGGRILVRGGLFRRPADFPQEELAWSSNNGFLFLRRACEKKTIARMRLLAVWNAALLAEALALRDENVLP